MELSVTQLQAKLMRDYYKYFSKYARGKKPDQKVAWVTAFTPVEIPEALDIVYVYPESYAAVIAASGKEQPLLEESDQNFLCCDCCSYSCCIEGNIILEKGPRGVLPVPDVLIATNNQCNTLPTWWNILAQRYQVPLIVLDYPGETADSENSFQYVTQQHKALIREMEELSGNQMDYDKLEGLIGNSIRSVEAWNRIVELMPDHDIQPTFFFDTISFLITSRCKEETAQLYHMLAEELKNSPPSDQSKPGLFWLGYPLWYHPKRYLEELLSDVRISGANYITWWSVTYLGSTVFEQLYHAYNFTFLNLSRETKLERLVKLIKNSGAVGAITLRNKSCKCDFVSARDVGLPQAELEIDMIDREFTDLHQVKRQIDQLLEGL